jgi:hypothetical protein
MKSFCTIAFYVAAMGLLSLSNAAASAAFCNGLKMAVERHVQGTDAAFVSSYDPGTNEVALPAGLATTAFTYDNALAAIALVACGDVQDAKIIGNALSRAAGSDRTFTDGRIRNAYRPGALGKDPPKLPGWWDTKANIWAEDPAQDGTSSGNVAWAALALLTLHEATGDGDYLANARRLVGWIIDTTACSPVGFCGGFHGYDPQQVRLTWMSTEHNADIYAAAIWLHRLTGEKTYADAAQRARRFLDKMFTGDHFLIGTKPDGSLNDGALLALDAQLWTWMAVPDAPASWRKSLRFVEQHFKVDNGFDFNTDRDGVWVEGTAQAALAYEIGGNAAESRRLIDGMLVDRTPSGLLNATRIDRLTTGLSIDPTSTTPDFFYFRRPHLGATAWAALAETGWNPFLGRKVQ